MGGEVSQDMSLKDLTEKELKLQLECSLWLDI